MKARALELMGAGRTVLCVVPSVRWAKQEGLLSQSGHSAIEGLAVVTQDEIVTRAQGLVVDDVLTQTQRPLTDEELDVLTAVRLKPGTPSPSVECPACGSEVAKDQAASRVSAEVQAAWARADERIEQNADGSFILRLYVPIVVDGEKTARLTLRPIRVRDVRAVRGAGSEAELYAERLIAPAGAFDEIASDADFTIAIRAVSRALGNFRGGGAPS